MSHKIKKWFTLQRQNAENLKQIFTEKEYRGLSPNFHIHASVNELYIPTMGLPFLLEEICGPILGIYKSLTDTWMWKLGLTPPAEAVLFSEKEYINGIAVAVYSVVSINKDGALICSLCSHIAMAYIIWQSWFCKV